MIESTKQMAESDFPHAPSGWTTRGATKKAEELSITMGPEHWEIIICLQEYFARNDVSNRRELTDALDEFWHIQGGLKDLYRIFPGGPVTQGCAIAGIDIPPGSVDQSFGSVV